MRHHEQFEFLGSNATERAGNDAHGASASDHDDSDAELLRDTVAFHLGMVGTLLLEQTFAHADAAARYYRWLRDVRDDDPSEDRHELAHAGLGAEGSLQLVARPRVDEFLGHLEHPHFSALLSLAYSVAEREIIGIHLVSFSGKPMLATRWLRGLRRALLGRTPSRSTSSFVN